MNRNVLKAMRLLLLTASERRYVAEMKQSGLFDRQFYLTTNPTMHRLNRWFPERHFLLRGEPAGLWPNPDFSPKDYLHHSPDVVKSGMPPFRHYLKVGRHENRLTKHVAEIEPGAPLPTPILRDRPAQSARNAVVVHIYYHELWDEFSKVLQGLDIEFDLLVSITVRSVGGDTSGSTQLKARIEAEFPGAHVFELRNHGRDIFPFLHLVNAGWLDGYEAVCKIHTKKSPHRSDGDDWRQHLIGGVLPGDKTGALLAAFKADTDAAFWVADGQNYSGAQWWGSNFDRVTQLLHRVEVPTRRDHLVFPAGSIYWLKPLMIAMIRGLQLSETQFESEMGQTDGTLAHAIERTLGHLVEAAGMVTRQTSELGQSRQGIAAGQVPTFVSAFYLPQFHPVPENDAWWGKGFTEWTGVSRARPLFTGHMQPQLPADLGFYDLRLTEVMGQQTELARRAGIDAFCTYHYWFDGRRILEAPIDRLLARPDVDFPFYLCWANESWRRNWDGLTGEVLLNQSYAPGWEDALATSLLPYFNDPRYCRPDGERPRFVIYRPEDMPDPARAIAALRAAWVRLGVGEVELGAVRFHIPGDHPVPPDLVDFWIEMPPHGLVKEDDYLFGGPQGNQMGPALSPGFAGLIYDYAKIAAHTTEPRYMASMPDNTIAGVMPSWDNTARRGIKAHIAWGANPASFDLWLRRVLAGRVAKSYRGELFINSWNEWGEKAAIEPSAQYGSAWLDVLRRRLTLNGRSN